MTFEDDQGAYDQFDAQGFIKLNALRLRLGGECGATRRSIVGRISAARSAAASQCAGLFPVRAARQPPYCPSRCRIAGTCTWSPL